MKQTLNSLQNLGVCVMDGENLVDLEYEDNILLVFEEFQQAQSVMGKLTDVIPSSDRHCTTEVESYALYEHAFQTSRRNSRDRGSF